MSLPSQIGRIGSAGSGRTYMVSRRKSRRRRPLVAGVVVLGAAGALGWLWMNKPPTDAEASAPTVGLDEPDDRDTFPFGAAERAATVRVPPPGVELNMGEGVTGAEDPPAQPDEHATAQRPETEPEAEPDPKPREPEAPARVDVIAAAQAALSKNDPTGARSLLNAALRERTTPERVRSQIRAMLTDVNDELIFSPRLFADDTLTESYKVQGGDSLSAIATAQGLATDWRLIQRVNRISNPRSIRTGQTIKLVRGPFHAVVEKSAFRMDIYAGDPEDPRAWSYVRSFPVGLGKDDGTPAGEFVIAPKSKMINPEWTNPKTGERFHADDPDNPIGEYWLGLEGVGPYAALVSYGIHGTIEPDSIGDSRSMGCVRLGDEDIAFVYELLTEGISRVIIRD
jgi:lipoprotein-anchoring transpeptidase ErfK/SrfK